MFWLFLKLHRLKLFMLLSLYRYIWIGIALKVNEIDILLLLLLIRYLLTFIITLKIYFFNCIFFFGGVHSIVGTFQFRRIAKRLYNLRTISISYLFQSIRGASWFSVIVIIHLYVELIERHRCFCISFFNRELIWARHRILLILIPTLLWRISKRITSSIHRCHLLPCWTIPIVHF